MESVIMKFHMIITFLYLTVSESLSATLEQADSSTSLKGNTAPEKNVWNITLDIYFSKNLPQVLQKPPGSDIRLKCEAIMNYKNVAKYTKNKEGVETLMRESPPDFIQQNLMKNLKVYWLKDNKVFVDSLRRKVSTKIDKINGTIINNLRLKDLEDTDAGNYTCVIKQSFERRQTTKLIVTKTTDDIENYEIPTYSSLFPNSLDKVEIIVKTTPQTTVDIQNNKTKSFIPEKLEPICQEYVGKVCAFYLKAHFVYIPFNTTQAELEAKLLMAIQVTQYSNEISSQCEGYALPSLCYSTFPICRNPFVTNDDFYKEAKQIFDLLSIMESENDADSTPQVIIEPSGLTPRTATKTETIKNLTNALNYRYNSTVLKRVCKQDCEILENELCQTEYAIAKRHPHIGQQLTLEECQDLPEDDMDCLKIGIGPLMVSEEECYWENGNGYLGQVNVASNGLNCIEWSKQLLVRISEHPQLAGRHSYCRNPGGMMSQPWCIVEKDGKLEQQLCDIPKCAHKIWIYIVIIFLTVTTSIVCFIILLCYKHRNKNNAAAIRDINLPNADKNIYGNSRLNSPMEMNELLTNQNNINNQPHLTRNTRGNGVIRVPQYSLSQIKFLEELGEGAFGKVYKGAIKKDGEVLYVAVKALKENASSKTQADFKREIDLISELTHENIVCIVGVALREEPLCMLFEFMARGDLHEFLMGRAPPNGKGLPTLRLLHIASNIASGMQYLASHHYVHRDLAARNCLVSDDFVVKISDFGLSRDIYSSDYYRVQSKSLLPVRWMPPESILYGKFTTESDIWSYGVVLWEIYSYGLQPYYSYSNQEVISMVRGGEQLAPPVGCPQLMYNLMKDCWKHNPQRRPNFEEIDSRIQQWIQMGGCPETTPSESGSTCSHKPGSSRDLQERAPLLLVSHCSMSNGSLATNSLKKFHTLGSRVDDNRSTCSEAPPLAPKKKHSSGSLIDTDKVTRETVVRIPHARSGNEI